MEKSSTEKFIDGLTYTLFGDTSEEGRRRREKEEREIEREEQRQKKHYYTYFGLFTVSIFIIWVRNHRDIGCWGRYEKFMEYCFSS